MSIDPQSIDLQPYKWLRDINRFEHTVAFSKTAASQPHDSLGLLLDRKFTTVGGDFIGDQPEVKAIVAVWYGANQFYGFLDEMKLQAEQTCNVIAALAGVARHDAVLDEETWTIVNNMQTGSFEATQLLSSIRALESVLIQNKRIAAGLGGVYRPAHKAKVEGRLNRFIAENEAMLQSFRGMLGDFALPQTAYQARQYVLSELILKVERALEYIAPMRRELQDAPLPEGFWQRIIDNEGAFYRARAQLKKWRDNPSQKFGSKMKEMAILLQNTCLDMARMKDDSYHACSKLGLRFFNRCGYVNYARS